MGYGGGSTTTIVNEPPARTPEQTEADRLRLIEMQRQNQLAEALLPGQLALIDQQRQILQFQIDNHGTLTHIQEQELELRRLQIQDQIANQAMMEELRPQQLQFLQSQNRLAIQQLEALSETTAFQREANKFTLNDMRDRAARLQARNAAYSPAEEAQAAAEEARRASRMGAISEEAARIQLENLQRGNKPTAEQLANINESIDAAQKYGESDIKRHMVESLRTIQEEVAQAAGLRATDAPNVRLSERAGEEASRAQGDLTTKLAETRATARLNYPLASNKLESDMADSLSRSAGGAANFQSELRLQAANNRAQAFNMPSSVGFALPPSSPTPSLSFMNPGAVGYNPNAFNLLSGSNAPGGSNSSGSKPIDYAGTAAGIGGILASLGAMGYSDARLKTDIKRVGTTAAGLPIFKYRYKGDPELRYGVMAQQVQRLFPNAVSEDEEGFLMVDHSKVY